MKGRRKIPDALKTLRSTDQPCRMTGGAKPPTTNVVAVPRSGLKGTARKVFGIVAAELIHKRLLESTVEYIDAIGQLHGTWGGLAVIPEEDEFVVIG